MNSSARRLKIYDMLLENETVDVSELSKLFGVSPMTIRRDLAIYEKQGMITTTYGGAYLNTFPEADNDIPSAAIQLDDATRRIGTATARLLNNGDTVFINGGDTTLGLVYGIRNLKLRVVTNSITAANILRTFPKIELIMAPGTYHDDYQSFLSSSTIAFIRQFNFDAAVICTEYIDYIAGLTSDHETDVHLKATAMDNAKRNIVLIRSENIGQVAFAQVTSLRKIDYMVTDNAVSEDLKKTFEQRGVKVVAEN